MAEIAQQNQILEEKARDIIHSIRMSHRQPIWIIAIVIIGGIIGPAGGLINAYLDPSSVSDFWGVIAVIVVFALLLGSPFLLPLCFQHVSFDGKGVNIKPFLGNPRNFDWKELIQFRIGWYGAAIQSANQKTLRLLGGDEFYHNMVNSCLIWENRFVDDSDGS